MPQTCPYSSNSQIESSPLKVEASDSDPELGVPFFAMFNRSYFELNVDDGLPQIYPPSPLCLVLDRLGPGPRLKYT
jgi:hypothetical protein